MSTQTTDANSHILGETLALFHTPQEETYATMEVKSHRETWALASMGFRQRLERQYDEANGTMPSSKTIKNDLRDLTDTEQVTLVQDVLRRDQEAIETFLRCTERLLTQITYLGWGEEDAGVWAEDRCRRYHRLDRVLYPFTYLVYGLRSTGYAESSPLQRWLDHPETRIPLEKYVACVARHFLHDRRRKKAIERMTIFAYALPQAYDDDTDGAAPNYYDHLEDGAGAIAEEVAVYRTYHGWWEQCTPADRTLLHLLSPKGEAMTLAEAAQQLDTSIPTLHRRRKQLHDHLVALLTAA